MGKSAKFAKRLSNKQKLGIPSRHSAPVPKRPAPKPRSPTPELMQEPMAQDGEVVGGKKKRGLKNKVKRQKVEDDGAPKRDYVDLFDGRKKE